MVTKFLIATSFLFSAAFGQLSLEQAIQRIEIRRSGQVIQERPDTATIRSVVLICIKSERKLELWINGKFTKTYPMTAFSGSLGPKKAQGDGQIPEGIYRAEHLNPNSSFYLSIKVSYPNAWDKQWAKEQGRSDLGGDIFIHGSDVTIGCIPIGDKNIEEVFWSVYKAGCKNTKILISPHDFRKPKYVIPDEKSKLHDLYVAIREELRKYPR